MNKSDASEHEHLDEDEVNSKYIPPRNVPISELWNKDQDDQSLTKYKQQLIGGAINVIIEPSIESKLILKKLVLIPEDHGELVFDLKENVDRLKDQVIALKEGAVYRMKLQFYVQRDIVSGLKLVQTAHKGPIRTDKSTYMMGSRAPKAELQEYISEKEVAPSGLMARGKYHMKSSITDDDKNIYAKWEWTLEISKDWK
ncbi:Rho GDP-dissociation inhibitor 1 [Brachionus plicatilis]|uniref:Rho GDP-dissociation inhibitor 1 n=1 Tax=Brachionus plicatilis TaxID=10195 RepID=A0A3M7P765_BRAPC|nr:Rho GDP-dissociation inhibitor 1 [Brachionus plicatilis]